MEHSKDYATPSRRAWIDPLADKPRVVEVEGDAAHVIVALAIVGLLLVGGCAGFFVGLSVARGCI